MAGLSDKPTRQNFPVPPEVRNYFAEKGLKPAFSWQDVFNEEHAYAFTVAKAVELELLTAFKSTLQQSIDAGEGLESWKKRILPELQRLGWDRPRMVADPTGAWKDKEVNFAAPRRLETIFWSNVRTARAAGQWERIQRTKEGLPYLLYVRTTSLEPRIEHLGWVGLILPIDHEFWATHFPPNGWNCKCSVRQITARERDKLLALPGYTDQAPEIGFTDFENRRTGEMIKVPVGIDPGWGTNPGLSRARTLVELAFDAARPGGAGGGEADHPGLAGEPGAAHRRQSAGERAAAGGGRAQSGEAGQVADRHGGLDVVARKDHRRRGAAACAGGARSRRRAWRLARQSAAPGARFSGPDPVPSGG